jgi:hypothetical protein
LMKKLLWQFEEWMSCSQKIFFCVLFKKQREIITPKTFESQNTDNMHQGLDDIASVKVWSKSLEKCRIPLTCWHKPFR